MFAVDGGVFMANKLALVPDGATLAMIQQGFADERRTLEADRSKCTSPEMIRFYTEKIALLRSAEAMGCILMAVTGECDWESVHNLELALYLCMSSPDRETMVEARREVVTAFRMVSADLNARAAEQLAREREATARECERTAQEQERTKKARADAIAAERQTHNWLWRVFN
jgi:hypothetical protein